MLLAWRQTRIMIGDNCFVVTGDMGAGKTTLAGTLSSLLDAPHVEMDALRHGAKWVETPDNVFRERVSQAQQCQQILQPT